MAPDDWIPVGAAAGYIDEPVERLFKLLEQGTIESEIPGRGVSRNSCDLWLANQKVRHNEAVEVTIHPEERESPPAKRRQGPKPPKGYISVSRAAKLLDSTPAPFEVWCTRVNCATSRSAPGPRYLFLRPRFSP
jgi:hypothetical protein